jgi:hypothetical protein
MMKKLSILFFLLCVNKVDAQENASENKLKFFDEFGISFNHSDVSNANITDKNGFGVRGMYNLQPEKKLAVLVGLEYTRTHWFKKFEFLGHYAHLTDLDIHISSVGIPAVVRYTIGENTKLLLEAGGFFELNVATRSRGTYHSYLPNDPIGAGTFDYKVGFYEGEEAVSPFGFGPTAGIGVKVKLPKNFILLRTFYKLNYQSILADTSEKYNNCLGVELGIGFK